MVKHEHTRGSGGMLPQENLIFRSSKTAGNAPKSRILLILSLSMGIHLYSSIKKNSYSTRCTRLKLALHVRDLVEFCHTLQTGLMLLTATSSILRAFRCKQTACLRLSVHYC